MQFFGCFCDVVSFGRLKYPLFVAEKWKTNRKYSNIEWRRKKLESVNSIFVIRHISIVKNDYISIRFIQLQATLEFCGFITNLIQKPSSTKSKVGGWRQKERKSVSVHLAIHWNPLDAHVFFVVCSVCWSDITHIETDVQAAAHSIIIVAFVTKRRFVVSSTFFSGISDEMIRLIKWMQ